MPGFRERCFYGGVSGVGAVMMGFLPHFAAFIALVLRGLERPFFSPRALTARSARGLLGVSESTQQQHNNTQQHQTTTHNGHDNDLVQELDEPHVNDLHNKNIDHLVNELQLRTCRVKVCTVGTCLCVATGMSKTLRKNRSWGKRSTKNSN